MRSPKSFAREKSVKRRKNETRGVDINTCSDSSPTGS